MEVVSEDDLLAALESMSPHLTALNAAAEQSEEAMEGNILYMHQSTEPNPKNLPKQRNLFSLAASLPLQDSTVVEIGFNAGHSSLLMLSAHPKLRVVAFDLCEHAYTDPCFGVLAAAFPGRIQLVRGRSQQTLPRWAKENDVRADLVHIDGDQEPQAARADLQNAKLVARAGAWVVFDDTCFTPLRAVWTEMLAAQLIQVPELAQALCATSRHGIARYTRDTRARQKDDLWDLRPALEHRGRMRHTLVLAPTDHGQDSLLGYLCKHRLWRGSGPCKKLVPSTTQRHQSQWMSLPLRYMLPCELPCLVQLLAPHFADAQQISDCFPLADGVLMVVDCAEGLAEDFCRIAQAAVAAGLQPLLFLNKLDKLLSLDPDNESCFRRLVAIVDRLNRLIQASSSLRPLCAEEGSIVFGRGSLSVAESIGGWGFQLEGWLQEMARRKAWTEEQVAKLRLRAWSEKGFCRLVLQPLREIFSLLEAPQAQNEADLAKLRELGVVPQDGLLGNAWKQSGMEAWLPLADLLLGALVKTTPAPQEPPPDAVFYAARCVESTDGHFFALGRPVSPQVVAANPGLPQVAASASAAPAASLPDPWRCRFPRPRWRAALCLASPWTRPRWVLP